MTSCFFAHRSSRAVLTLAGADRVSFLQGLVSNDVTKVAPDHSLWAALLTPQGKFLFDLFISDANESLLVDAEASRLNDLKKKLSLYKLRSQVAIDALAEHSVFVAWGEGVAARFGLPATAGAAKQFPGGGTACVDPRLVEAGVRLVIPAASAPAILAEVGLVAGDGAQWDELRLELGLPEGSADLVPDQTVLLEAGFDELGGVDFKKGCYMGQELTARTKYRGLVKKRVLPVEINGDVPAPGTAILAGGDEVGDLRSTQGGRGLALVRLDAVRAGSALTCGGARLTVRVPAWAVLPE